jgi:hypothetical protein
MKQSVRYVKPDKTGCSCHQTTHGDPLGDPLVNPTQGYAA